MAMQSKPRQREGGGAASPAARQRFRGMRAESGGAVLAEKKGVRRGFVGRVGRFLSLLVFFYWFFFVKVCLQMCVGVFLV